MKRILFFNSFSGIGGADKGLIECACFCKEQKWEAIVVLFKDGPLKGRLLETGAQVRIVQTAKHFLLISKDNPPLLNLWYLLISLPGLVKTFIKISLIIRQTDPHALFSNSYKTDFITCLLGKVFRKKVILFLHNFLPKGKFLRRMTTMFYFSLADLIFVISESVKKDLLNSSHKPMDKMIEVLYCSYQIPELRSQETKIQMRQKYGFSGSDYIVGSVGMLVPWKGQEYLIRAAPMIFSQIPPSKILIVGDKIYDSQAKGSREALGSLVKELGLEGSVLFTGFLVDPWEVFSIMDVFVHTSISPEPLGRVIIEAVLSKVPVIASNQGGPQEIIEDTKTGSLIPPADPKALAQAVQRIYQDPVNAQQMAENAFQKVSKKFAYKRQMGIFISNMERFL